MLVLLTLLTAGYAAVVVRVLRARRRATSRPAAVAGLALPPDDRPPPSAHGWPPVDEELFAAYVADGFAALDAYLSEGYAA